MPGQRLLSQLNLFEKPEVVLLDAKYWNPEFVRQFIEAWDDVAYLDPHAGMELAKVAIELVDHLDEEDQTALKPRALATLGSSHRAFGELVEADDLLESVGELYTRTRLPRLDEADYCRRMIYLRRDQRRYSEAIEFADRAIGLCQAELADHELGRAYGARGTVYVEMRQRGKSGIPREEPIESFSQAVKRVDPRDEHAYHTITHNLAWALLTGHQFDLQKTLAMLDKARQQQSKLRIRRKSLPNAQLRWGLGLVYLRVGMLARAEQLLRRSRRVILDLGFLQQFVAISLDLGLVYDHLNKWGLLRALAEEILSIEGVHSSEGLAALKAWQNSIARQDIGERIWRKVRKTVRWAPQVPPKRKHLRQAR